MILSQPLELNGTRSARAGVANAQLRVTQAQAVIELREVVFSVRAAYYQLAQARAQQALAADLLRNAEEFDRISRRLVEAGKRPGIELAQTGIEVSRAQQQVTLADAQAAVAAAALNTLLGLPADAPLAALSPLTPSTDAVDETALLRQALAARAEIASVEAARETFQQQARLARAEGRPDLCAANSFRQSGARRPGRHFRQRISGSASGFRCPFSIMAAAATGSGRPKSPPALRRIALPRHKIRCGRK